MRRCRCLEGPQHGCEHYPYRDCAPIFTCCGGEYGCRFCHDAEAPAHGCGKLAEAAGGSVVRDMRCLSCMCVQPAARACQNPDCARVVGTHYCDVCRLWESDPAKIDRIWHCDKCGMCRIVKDAAISSMVHCDGCKLCVPRDVPHTCRDISEQVCCACQEVLLTSKRIIVPLHPCTHVMHEDCYVRWALACPTATSIGFVTCPTCRHSVVNQAVKDFFAAEGVRHAQLVAEAKAVLVAAVWCNDCNTQTETKISCTPGAPLLCGASECRSLNVSQKGEATLEFAHDVSPVAQEIMRMSMRMFRELQ